MEALVRGITVYMIVIEGTLALTGARFILRSLKETDRLPGFRDGFTHVNRDESRHVGFGVKFLADAIKEDERYKQVVQETLQETLPVGVLAFSPDWVEDRYDFETPVRLPLHGDVRVRDEARCRRSSRRWGWRRAPPGRRLERAPPRPARGAGPGRPGVRRARSASSRPRYEVLKRDGYAGLTTAKVAAASGQNKALISYYFGSKQGLVAAVARRVSETITDEVLGRARRAARRRASWSRRSPTASVAGDGPRRGPAARLLRPRLAGRGRARGRRDHARDEAGPPGDPARAAARRSTGRRRAELDGIAIFLVAGLEGLSLERLERGDTPGARRAREIFVDGDGGDRAPLSAPASVRRAVLALLRKAFALRPPPALRLRLLRWMAGSVVREFPWALLARDPGRDRDRWSPLGALARLARHRDRRSRSALAELALGARSPGRACAAPARVREAARRARAARRRASARASRAATCSSRR